MCSSCDRYKLFCRNYNLQTSTATSNPNVKYAVLKYTPKQKQIKTTKRGKTNKHGVS